MNAATEKSADDIAAAKNAEYQRQQIVHAHRVHTAGRKHHRKIAERSQKANRP